MKSNDHIYRTCERRYHRIVEMSNGLYKIIFKTNPKLYFSILHNIIIATDVGK